MGEILVLAVDQDIYDQAIGRAMRLAGEPVSMLAFAAEWEINNRPAVMSEYRKLCSEKAAKSSN